MRLHNVTFRLKDDEYAHYTRKAGKSSLAAQIRKELKLPPLDEGKRTWNRRNIPGVVRDSG